MPGTAQFFDVLSLSFQITNSGITSMRTLVASSEHASAVYIAVLLIVVPSPPAFQLYRIGHVWKSEAKKNAAVHAAMMANTTAVASLSLGVQKTFR